MSIIQPRVFTTLFSYQTTADSCPRRIPVYINHFPPLLHLVFTTFLCHFTEKGDNHLITLTSLTNTQCLPFAHTNLSALLLISQTHPRFVYKVNRFHQYRHFYFTLVTFQHIAHKSPHHTILHLS